MSTTNKRKVAPVELKAPSDPNETIETSGESEGPSITDCTCDGCWMAKPLPDADKDAPWTWKARFRLHQLANIALIALGIQVTFKAAQNAFQRVASELENPSTSISIEATQIEGLNFPQLVFCAFGGNLSIPDENGQPIVGCDYTHWTGGNAEELSQTCPDMRFSTFNAFGYDEECVYINGPEATVPYVSYFPGYSNRIDINFTHALTCNASGTNSSSGYSSSFDYASCVNEMGGIMYWGMFENKRVISTDDIWSLANLIPHSVQSVFALRKTIQDNKVTGVYEEFFEAFSSWTQIDGFEISNTQEYVVTLNYGKLSVERVTLENLYGWSQALSEIGGANGLVLGIGGMHLLTWSMQLCGVAGWAQEQPEREDPKQRRAVYA